MFESLKEFRLKSLGVAPKTPVVLDALAVALFFTYAIIAFGATGSQNLTQIVFSQINIPLILESLAVLVITSLMGPQSRAHSLFLLGTLGALLTYSAQLAFLFFPLE